MKYEDFVNRRYKEPEDGQPRRFSSDSNTDYEEEMEPAAAIPAQLAENFHNFNYYSLGFFRTVIFVSAYYY